MRIILLPMLVFCSLLYSNAQDYTEFTAITRKLHSLKGAELETAWADLVSRKKIPLVCEDSVAFLYRGEARNVDWMGDFNAWGSSKQYHNKGIRIADSNLWMLKLSLPKDARLDYKIVINDNVYLLDPLNPYSQWSGVGGGSQNSELRMPAWKLDSLAGYSVNGSQHGTIIKDLFLESKYLGYQLTYSLYIPVGYDTLEPTAVMYVTDGYEYMHDRLGNMTTILDNLIHLKKIKPVVAVFIDHREPVNRSVNRRIQELAMNEKYRNFIIQELIPLVETKYNVSKESDQRAIIGTSVGGLSAAYFAFSKPETFGLAGLQSPSFWFKPEVYQLCQNAVRAPVRTFISTGLINDAKEGTQKMKAIFEDKGIAFKYFEINQGHSWGNFRDQIDDMLVYLFPSE